MSIKLPVVDLRLSKTTEDRKVLAQTAKRALIDSGFIYLDGVEGYNPDVTHDLCKWFYGLPLEARMSISKKMFDPSLEYIYRGYFPVQPGNQSHKEAFEMGSFLSGPGKAPYDVCQFFFEDNQWPTDLQNDKPFASYFRTKMEEHYKALTNAGLLLLELVAEAWGAKSNLYTDMFKEGHLSTYRLIHYPSRGEDVPDIAKKDGHILRCDEHQDSGFVTMLETFDYGGLQIRDNEGNWRDVENRPGSLVVNIGILLSKITGEVLKATPHRVVDYGGDRFSCPYFLEPNYAADVNRVTGQKDEKWELLSTGPKQSYGRWLLKNLIGYIEYESLKTIEIPE